MSSPKIFVCGDRVSSNPKHPQGKHLFRVSSGTDVKGGGMSVTSVGEDHSALIKLKRWLPYG